MSNELSNVLAPASLRQALEAADLAYARGELQNAAICLLAAVEFDPRNADLVRKLGELQYEQGDYEAAQHALCKALELDPSLVEALNSLGVVLYCLGRLAGADLCFRKALELDPGNESAQANLMEMAGQTRGADVIPDKVRRLVRLRQPIDQPQAAGCSEPAHPRYGPRAKVVPTFSSLEEGLQIARGAFSSGRFLEAFDCYERLVARMPAQAIPILSEVYDCYQALPDPENRFPLYQSRFFEFGIQPGDKVLDIGSGHLPFPHATHLAEFAVHDDEYGRAGLPFRHVNGLPVFECSVEDMPFEDQAFDFIYCSHVLEHVGDPARACRELMRVGKRGYIETPTPGKDLWLNTAQMSNHRWGVELIDQVLVFTEYSVTDIEGLQSDVLMRMNCDPQTEREKAFAALLNLKADRTNTMLLWEGKFEFAVRRCSG